MLGLELVSSHSIDRILYFPVGLFLASALYYFACGGVMALGAVLERRHAGG